LRRLHDEVVRPIAVESTQGAWYRGWRVVSLDGSSLERANDQAFGRPGASRGESACLQLHFVSLVEKGAGPSHSIAQQDAGPGASGVLRRHAIPLRHPGLMHEAALKADEDPDRLSFVHAMRVIRRKLPIFQAIPPRGESDVP